MFIFLLININFFTPSMVRNEDLNLDILLDNGKMDQEKARILLVSNGYILEPNISIPDCESFADLIEFSTTLQKKYTKENIYEGLISLNGGDNIISNSQLYKFLSVGPNRLTDNEIREFTECLPVVDGGYCLKDIFNEAYIWDDVKK